MSKVSLKNLGATATKPKIESPLAKYNSAGQLFCVLCNTPVKNEMYWTGHVNGKSHRENVMALKNKGKRPAPEESESPEVKKLKAHSLPVTFSRMMMPPPSTTSVPVSKTSQSKYQSMTSTSATTPMECEEDRIAEEKQKLAKALAEDSELDTSESSNGVGDIETVEEGAEDKNSTEASNVADLPEGFFDDPKLDAKARGKEFKDPEEAEWEKFMKEISAEEIKSTTMINVDEEESTKSRELDEIEEQMSHWQRVIDLERKAEELRKNAKDKKPDVKATESEDMDDDLEYDEGLDWRSKHN